MRGVNAAAHRDRVRVRRRWTARLRRGNVGQRRGRARRRRRRRGARRPRALEWVGCAQRRAAPDRSQRRARVPGRPDIRVEGRATTNRGRSSPPWRPPRHADPGGRPGARQTAARKLALGPLGVNRAPPARHDLCPPGRARADGAVAAWRQDRPDRPQRRGDPGHPSRPLCETADGGRRGRRGARGGIAGNAGERACSRGAGDRRGRCRRPALEPAARQ